jgi:hypothetical protein
LHNTTYLERLKNFNGALAGYPLTRKEHVMHRMCIFLSAFLLVLFLAKESDAIPITGGYFYSNRNKIGLAANTQASSENFTNTVDGIGTVVITFNASFTPAQDAFSARTGNSNDAGNWLLYPHDITISDNQAAISVGTLTNSWLEIGYGGSDYLYFGNLAGDANFDGNLSPLDALLVIDYLNDPSGSTDGAGYDINGDGDVSPIDALIIVNILNSNVGDYPQLASGPFDPSSTGSTSTNFFPLNTTPFQIYTPSGTVNILDEETSYDQSLNLALISGPTQPNLYAIAMVTPVPEPATMLLLGSGLVALAGFGRRFRKTGRSGNSVRR